MGGGTQLEWIATLRGVAAMLVFISHLPLNMTYEIRFVIGRIGVTAFFLISGFLAVSSRKRMSGKEYMLNRFVRIYPVYWILVLLMCLVMDKQNLSIWRITANLTCFQEFLGQENILGASWMLPIQITFFMIIAIMGIDFFAGRGADGRRSLLTMTVFGIMAILLGVLRYITGKPFPTAFFLLICVAFLGVFYKKMLDGDIDSRQMRIILLLFEICLISAVILSYPDMMIHYIGAYNLGIVMTWITEKMKIKWEPFKRLGSIGLVFFLGADIPYVFISRFVDMSSSAELRIVSSIVKYILALPFAYIITRFIEKPIHKQIQTFLTEKTNGR